MLFRFYSTVIDVHILRLPPCRQTRVHESLLLVAQDAVYVFRRGVELLGIELKLKSQPHAPPPDR